MTKQQQRTVEITRRAVELAHSGPGCLAWDPPRGTIVVTVERDESASTDGWPCAIEVQGLPLGRPVARRVERCAGLSLSGLTIRVSSDRAADRVWLGVPAHLGPIIADAVIRACPPQDTADAHAAGEIRTWLDTLPERRWDLWREERERERERVRT